MTGKENVLEGQLTAKAKKFAIVVSRFNELITRKLLEGALDCLYRHETVPEDVIIAWVPGAFEIPLTAKKLAQQGRYNAIICLGAVIRSDTPHFDYVSAEVSKGIAQVGLEMAVPTIFGVITADTLDQAVARAGAPAGNRGWDAALSAIEMADLIEKID